MVFISPDHKALFFLGGCILGGVRLTSHKHVFFLEGFHSNPQNERQPSRFQAISGSIYEMFIFTHLRDRYIQQKKSSTNQVYTTRNILGKNPQTIWGKHLLQLVHFFYIPRFPGQWPLHPWQSASPPYRWWNWGCPMSWGFNRNGRLKQVIASIDKGHIRVTNQFCIYLMYLYLTCKYIYFSILIYIYVYIYIFVLICMYIHIIDIFMSPFVKGCENHEQWNNHRLT